MEELNNCSTCVEILKNVIIWHNIPDMRSSVKFSNKERCLNFKTLIWLHNDENSVSHYSFYKKQSPIT